jgi:hypothetical protein
LAKPKLAAYSHLVFLASDKVPCATVDDIVAGTRETYDGPLQVGEDLMSFEIGDTVIVSQRRNGITNGITSSRHHRHGPSLRVASREQARSLTST